MTDNKPGIKLESRLKADGGLLLTPLIDMIFLVMIFFVVSASLSLRPSIPVDTPEGESAQADTSSVIDVTLDASGSLYINDQEVSLDSYKQVLEQTMKQEGSRSIMIIGDKTISYNFLMQVLDISRLSGAEELSLEIKRRKNH